MEQSETFGLISMEQSVRSLIEDYEQKQKEIKEFDYNNLNDLQIETLKKFGQEKQLISKMAVAYEATAMSTVRISEGERNSLVGLTSYEEYTQNLDALTGGRDNIVISALEKELEGNSLSSMESKADDIREVVKTVNNFAVENDLKLEQSEQTVLTVADAQLAIEKTDTMLNNLEINKSDLDNLSENIIDTLLDKRMEGNVFEVESKENIKEREQEYDVGVTVSNDGYIMNTDSVVTAKTEKLYAELMREDATNESITPVAKETTTDPTRVGGNVKLETVNENGSMEIEERVPTHYEKEEINNNHDLEKQLEEAKAQQEALQQQRMYEEQQAELRRQEEQKNEEKNAPSMSDIAVGVVATTVAIQGAKEIEKAVIAEATIKTNEKTEKTTDTGKNLSKSLDNKIKKSRFELDR